jgi:hypothetical protein
MISITYKPYIISIKSPYWDETPKRRVTIFWDFFGTITAFLDHYLLIGTTIAVTILIEAFDAGSVWWSDESDPLSQIDIFIIPPELLSIC